MPTAPYYTEPPEALANLLRPIAEYNQDYYLNNQSGAMENFSVPSEIPSPDNQMTTRQDSALYGVTVRHHQMDPNSALSSRPEAAPSQTMAPIQATSFIPGVSHSKHATLMPYAAYVGNAGSLIQSIEDHKIDPQLLEQVGAIEDTVDATRETSELSSLLDIDSEDEFYKAIEADLRMYVRDDDQGQAVSLRGLEATTPTVEQAEPDEEPSTAQSNLHARNQVSGPDVYGLDYVVSLNSARAGQPSTYSNPSLLQFPADSCLQFATEKKHPWQNQRCPRTHVPWPTAGVLTLKPCMRSCEICGKVLPGGASDLRRHVHHKHVGQTFDPNESVETVKLYVGVQVTNPRIRRDGKRGLYTDADPRT